MTTSGERVNAVQYALRGQALDVPPQGRGVGGEQLGALGLADRVAVRLEEVRHRRLAVDDDMALRRAG